MSIRLVMLGDIVGAPGRQAVAQLVPTIRQRWQPDLIIANAENAAAGSGLTPQLYEKIHASGVDAMTLGDHVYRKKQIVGVLESQSNIIRPANLPAGAAGRSWMRLTLDKVDGKPNLYVITILGRLFMNLPVDEPFAAVDKVIASLPEKEPIVLVEIHAEATSEKQAMGWHLSGRVAAVIGSHTHVPTADARILPMGVPHAQAGGTAYISDMGMCGPYESVLGRQVDRVLTHMTTAMPAPFDVATGDPRVSGVFVEINPVTRHAVAIEQFTLPADPGAPPFIAQ